MVKSSAISGPITTEDIRPPVRKFGCEDYHCAHRRFADKPAIDCPFLRRLSANIDIITDGLDLAIKIFPLDYHELPGEIGQISQSVNNLARALRETRTLNDLIIENAADGVIAIDRPGVM